MWRQTVVQNCISYGKYTTYHSNNDKSGDSKTFVATIVANVATERMRLDTTVLVSELRIYDGKLRFSVLY
jgi:hypothetical protein